ncbi:hypothetical protein THAOC_04167, partial [Thalassiosira oceanica]
MNCRWASTFALTEAGVRVFQDETHRRPVAAGGTDATSVRPLTLIFDGWCNGLDWGVLSEQTQPDRIVSTLRLQLRPTSKLNPHSTRLRSPERIHKSLWLVDFFDGSTYAGDDPLSFEDLDCLLGWRHGPYRTPFTGRQRERSFQGPTWPTYWAAARHTEDVEDGGGMSKKAQCSLQRSGASSGSLREEPQSGPTLSFDPRLLPAFASLVSSLSSSFQNQSTSFRLSSPLLGALPLDLRRLEPHGQVALRRLPRGAGRLGLDGLDRGEYERVPVRLAGSAAGDGGDPPPGRE